MTATASSSSSAGPARHWRGFGTRVAAWWPSVFAVAFWVAAPLLCLYAALIGVQQLAHNLNDKAVGIPGTFTATSHNCQQQLCITSGTFTSDDARLVEPDLIGDFRWPVGSTSRAVYNAGSGEITGIADVWDPTPTLVGLAGSTIFLILWGYLVVVSRRRRRAEPTVVTASSGNG
ncbi:hypothetical protein SAMN05892883_4334 [Jatrophihabitans sp. GAS493]|uniref:hypothetical protein n=1 Tax=Jatrophihabitans sp. GAS493 TaxID=1907575 RepID=UPI000BB7FBF9|nr:hypothetical protein [Jatrophihabitans sp. GAS493]SOD75129.1 hypothetical protein SAMN05892883_4334 [Jatrophihabitans sp. GAS493]